MSRSARSTLMLAALAAPFPKTEKTVTVEALPLGAESKVKGAKCAKASPAPAKPVEPGEKPNVKAAAVTVPAVPLVPVMPNLPAVGSIDAAEFLSKIRTAGRRPNDKGIMVPSGNPDHKIQDLRYALAAYCGVSLATPLGAQIDAATMKAQRQLRAPSAPLEVLASMALRTRGMPADGRVIQRDLPDHRAKHLANLEARLRRADHARAHYVVAARDASLTSKDLLALVDRMEGDQDRELAEGEETTAKRIGIMLDAGTPPREAAALLAAWEKARARNISGDILAAQ